MQRSLCHTKCRFLTDPRGSRLKPGTDLNNEVQTKRRSSLKIQCFRKWKLSDDEEHGQLQVCDLFYHHMSTTSN